MSMDAAKRFRRRIEPGIPYALLASACLITASLLTSCRQEPPAAREQPLHLGKTPMVRVLLSPRPVSGARLASTGPVRVSVDGREIIATGRLDEILVQRENGQWKLGGLSASGRRVDVDPDHGSYARADSMLYRGSLVLLPAGPDTFRIVNHLDMESYLAGVLAKELYPHWRPTAFEAQAVAARTFAMYHKTTFGRSNDYDLGSNQNWQVYGGFSAETDKAWAAVRGTHGMVLAHGEPGQERLFLARYSACCGGVVNGLEVMHTSPTPTPMTGGQVCEDCREHRHYRWDPVRISKADVHRAVAAVYSAAAAMDGVSTITVGSETPYGRAVWLDLAAPNGRRIRIRAEDLRVCLIRAGVPEAKRLYSMNCRIVDDGDAFVFSEGRGHGHGVGMCQWGAEGKARQGWTYDRILQFYYPGARLFAAY